MIRRAASTKLGGTAYCALTFGTPIDIICMKSIRLSGMNTPIGSGVSKVPWRSARAFYLSSETVKSPRRFSDWLYFTRPRRDGVTSCTSNPANDRVREARKYPISWVYLFSAGKSRPRRLPLATILSPTKICPSYSCITWLTL